MIYHVSYIIHNMLSKTCLTFESSKEEQMLTPLEMHLLRWVGTENLAFFCHLQHISFAASLIENCITQLHIFLLCTACLVGKVCKKHFAKQCKSFCKTCERNKFYVGTWSRLLNGGSQARENLIHLFLPRWVDKIYASPCTCWFWIIFEHARCLTSRSTR